MESTDWGSEGRGGESGEEDNGEGEEAHRWFGLEGRGDFSSVPYLTRTRQGFYTHSADVMMIDI